MGVTRRSANGCTAWGGFEGAGSGIGALFGVNHGESFERRGD
jgi:hypothetical protein